MNSSADTPSKPRCRRTFLKTLVGASTPILLPAAAIARLEEVSGSMTLGVIADPHIGFVDDAESRFQAFMRDMAKLMPDGLIQLGDFAYPKPEFQKFADAINGGAEFVVHAIGNHDLDHGLTPLDCIKAWGIPDRYYTRVLKGLRVIALDGNEKGSPTHAKHGGYPSYVGPEQQAWLETQLETSKEPVLIVSHQPLAGFGAIDNERELQKLIGRHQEKVILCINGHSHVDQQVVVDGVTYLHCNSASYFWLGGKARLAKYRDPLYSTLTIDPAKSELRITGVRSAWADRSPEETGYFTGKKEAHKEIVVPEIRDREFPLPAQDSFPPE